MSTGKIADVISNIWNLQSHARGKHEEVYLIETLEDEARKHVTAWGYMERIRLGQGIVMAVFIGAIGFLTVWLWSLGRVSVGNIVLVLFKKLTDEEIINTHTGCFAISSLFFRNKRKIITNIHEVLATKNKPLLEKINGYRENIMLFIGAKYSNLTIVNTNYMKKLMVQKGINNIVVIHNWVDSQLFKTIKNKEVDKIFKKNKFKLLFVGRLVKRKGILELIASLNYIEDLNPQLLVIGAGELSSKIKEIERKNERVKLVGLVKHEELPKYYSAANLTIIPSYYEPFGLVPLESLSCGTPVLVANNSGLKEIIDSKIGFFISKIEPKIIADSIRKVLDKRKHSKTQYRKYVVDNYNLENIIKKYEIEYKN